MQSFVGCSPMFISQNNYDPSKFGRRESPQETRPKKISHPRPGLKALWSKAIFNSLSANLYLLMVINVSSRLGWHPSLSFVFFLMVHHHCLRFICEVCLQYFLCSHGIPFVGLHWNRMDRPWWLIQVLTIVNGEIMGRTFAALPHVFIGAVLDDD